MFKFDLLPKTVRAKIYDYCIPARFEFVGARNACDARWPDHPLSNLIRALPRYLSQNPTTSKDVTCSQEINTHIYSNCRFEFVARKTERCQKRVDGYEVAREFFRLIGPTQFRRIRDIYCDIHSTAAYENTDEIFGMLEDIASCPPARDIKNIHLEIELMQGVKRSTRGVRGKSVCFSLRGFPGVNITILILGSPAYQTTNNLDCAGLNTWFQQRYHPGESAFSHLPEEVRCMCYEYLVPHRYVLPGPHNDNEPRSQSATTMVSMLRLTNRLVVPAYCKILYKTCCFEIPIEMRRYYQQNNPRDDSTPWATSFIRQIGVYAKFISHFKITLKITGRLPEYYIPSVLPLVDALDRQCGLSVHAVDQNSPYTIVENRPISRVYYTFRPKTKARTMLTGTTLTIEAATMIMNIKKLGVNQVRTVVEASMNGIPTMIDSRGQIRRL